MKFKFIGNACGIFIGSKNTKILCDPWIKNGAFEGSWYHYPPLKTKIRDLQKVDAIYVSHIHPDHFDVNNFHFNKKKPIIILDQEPNFLKKILLSKGFENLILIKDNETIKFKEFKLTMYKPFSGHIFEESLLGNLIDSALVLENKNLTAINFNDNTPTLKSCEMLQKKFKNINLAMINYNAAGPYPSCFDNLTYNQKVEKNRLILKRNFDYMCKASKKLKANTILPFAGSYILGGKLYKKNKYLGTTTWDNCANYLRKKLGSKYNIICLRENDTYDLLKEKSDKLYEKIDIKHMNKYIKKIKSKKYLYEKDLIPANKKLRADIVQSSKNLESKIKKFNVKINSDVYLKHNKENIKIITGRDNKRKIFCSLDKRLLRRILDRKAHWNNAEIGGHINFRRYPDKMDPDVHTIMSFFHL